MAGLGRCKRRLPHNLLKFSSNMRNEASVSRFVLLEAVVVETDVAERARQKYSRSIVPAGRVVLPGNNGFLRGPLKVRRCDTEESVLEDTFQ